MKKKILLSLVFSFISVVLFAKPFGKVALTGLTMQNVPSSVQNTFLGDLGQTFQAHTSTKVTGAAKEADYIVSGAILNYKSGMQFRYNFKIVDAKGTTLGTAAGMAQAVELEDGGLALKLIQKFGPLMNANYSEREKSEAEWLAILNASETIVKEVIIKETPEQPASTTSTITSVNPKPTTITTVENYSFYSDCQKLAAGILAKVDAILAEPIPESGNIKVKIDFYNQQTEKWIEVVEEMNDFARNYGAFVVYNFSDIKYSFKGNGEEIRLEMVPGVKAFQNKIVTDTIRTFREKWNAFSTNPAYADMSDSCLKIRQKFAFDASKSYSVFLSIEDNDGYTVPIVGSGKTRRITRTANPSKKLDIIKRQSKYFDEEEFSLEAITIKKNDLPDDLNINNFKFSGMMAGSGSDAESFVPSFSLEEWQKFIKFVEN